MDQQSAPDNEQQKLSRSQKRRSRRCRQQQTKEINHEQKSRGYKRRARKHAAEKKRLSEEREREKQKSQIGEKQRKADLLGRKIAKAKDLEYSKNKWMLITYLLPEGKRSVNIKTLNKIGKILKEYNIEVKYTGIYLRGVKKVGESATYVAKDSEVQARYIVSHYLSTLKI
jgi:hypothetical protein